MRNRSDPTAKVIEHASRQPGHIISWSAAVHAYGTGIVKGHSGPVRASSKYSSSVSNVLRTHFERVEGAEGLYVLLSSMNNPDFEEDQLELVRFHDEFGCDEFGMSTRPSWSGSPGWLRRMSNVAGIVHRPGCDAELFEAAQSACGCERK